MSITDELREYALGWDERNRVRRDLEHIADRIDAALEGCIELPKDADGETIHLQDRMSWDNGMFNVHELNLTADGWTTWDELHGYTVRADQCHHVQPDSWERIINELAERVLRSRDQWGLDASEVKAEFVERCKRLAEVDA